MPATLFAWGQDEIQIESRVDGHATTRLFCLNNPRCSRTRLARPVIGEHGAESRTWTNGSKRLARLLGPLPIPTAHHARSLPSPLSSTTRHLQSSGLRTGSEIPIHNGT